ncbi:MAG: hypothetical protein OXC54_08005 [Rhodospirillaceae bacterium]|nr:hypothetical protein [Rhodospirillaceae bacterium]MCY4311235.1 hypothetical protein [Rhodospirillaceae bacterium]
MTNPSASAINTAASLYDSGDFFDLVARRIEDPMLPAALSCGQGNTVAGMDDRWLEGLEPWRLIAMDGKGARSRCVCAGCDGGPPGQGSGVSKVLAD